MVAVEVAGRRRGLVLAGPGWTADYGGWLPG